MIVGPKSSKELNLDQKKKVVMQGQILFTTVNFWFLATKYGI